ncbi:hypothetical protein F8388_024113 [Cannabis sativa]|uniref:B box-type domain-containing protein n=1 Tax=Cannabis sativa TaxID=3483 RepID=A0A7J6GKP6_CANSA|nr:hypothetical protein F8388_024113 [Cannabis sativa]KAF4383437.1 hypothetical protein G4B88_024011 [Cannabis sativa]
MKIRCDVCDKKEASVFCTADEAALCDDCDNRVHHANKLASKHSRFSLLQPGFKESPLCDICQERRAFLFCQEDRAILCRECDIPIHKANEHTQKHHRFLLTGAKLSPLSSSSSSITTTTSSEAAINRSSVTPLFSTTTTKRLKTVISNNNNNNEISSCSSIDEMTQFPYNSTTNNNNNNNNNSHESGCSYLTSSISEYLMETLPGWHVEDFLDPSSSSSCSASNNNNNNNNNGFCKTNNNDDFDSNKCYLNSSQDQADQVGQYDYWVP